MFRKPLRPQKHVRQRQKISPDSDDEVELDVSTSLKNRKKPRVISASSRCPSTDSIDKPNIIYEKISQTLPDKEAEECTKKESRSKSEAEILSGTEAEMASNIYRGLNSYHDPLNESKKASRIRFGPKKGAVNIRVSCMFDYKPDICKDYKETGYCGYGDSCVFLHDRGDYKTGWQLEKEWEKSQKEAREEENLSIESSNNDEKTSDLPFACFICRNPFKNPFKTRCNHYFCEKCITDWSRKSKRCYICGAITDGVILPAKEIASRESQVPLKINE